MEKIELTSIDPLAVCNDGSPAVYYWKKSTNNSKDWLLFLEGGGGCWSELTCEARKLRSCHLTSSKCDHATLFKGGVFDDRPENPLATANKAFLRYCSSDDFVGNSTQHAGFLFHGTVIVQAFIHHLE